MVSLNEVQAQLMSHESQFRYIGIAELKQLSWALQPGEQIMDCLKGWSGGMTTVLCATDKRLILLDKRTTKTTVQEIDYEFIQKLEHHDRGWSSVLRVHMSGKRYEFMSWHIKRLKTFHGYIERHVQYVKGQAKGAQELVDAIVFETNVRPKESTSRNWIIFAKRIGTSSLS